MRVLHVVHEFFPESSGGTESHILSLSSVLEKNHNIKCSVFSGSVKKRFIQSGVTKYKYENLEVFKFKKNFLLHGYFDNPLINNQITKAFVEVIEQFKPDLIHFHHLATLTPVLPVASLEYGIPGIMTIHDYWMICPLGQKLKPDFKICDASVDENCGNCLKEIRLQNKIFPFNSKNTIIHQKLYDRNNILRKSYLKSMSLIFESIKVFIAPSHHIFDEFAGKWIPETKIQYLEHGIPEFFIPGSSAKNVNDNSFRFGCLGSLIPSKGIHVLVEAFKELKHQNIYLDICGPAPRYHGNYGFKTTIKNLAGADKRITIHDKIPYSAIPNFYRRINALVVPSLWQEAFGLTAREAFAMGVPVIASKIGGLREAIIPGINGFLVEPGSKSELISAMKTIYEKKNTEFRPETIIENSHVKKMGVYAEEIKKIYEQILKPCSDIPSHIV